MRARRVEQTALTTFFLAACFALFMAACAAIAHAQNTLPQAPETPVSPTTPGTLPGTGAGAGSAIGTNPITGQPCLGGGGSAITGGIPGAATLPGEPGEPGQQVTGLPPSNSVYGLGNQLNTSSPGAC
jgi:hypothetical protein